MAVATNGRPTISLNERDRRYAAIRAQMKSAKAAEAP